MHDILTFNRPCKSENIKIFLQKMLSIPTQQRCVHIKCRELASTRGCSAKYWPLVDVLCLYDKRPKQTTKTSFIEYVCWTCFQIIPNISGTVCFGSNKKNSNKYSEIMHHHQRWQSCATIPPPGGRITDHVVLSGFERIDFILVLLQIYTVARVLLTTDLCCVLGRPGVWAAFEPNPNWSQVCRINHQHRSRNRVAVWWVTSVQITINLINSRQK